MISALRGLATVLIVAGVLVLADTVLTALWQEPLTAAVATLRQHRLSGDLRDLERSGLTPIERDVLARLDGQRRRIAFLARSLERRVPLGQAVGRVRIPRIGIDFVLVKGWRPPDLRLGPGIYERGSFPGVPGTTPIAAHRTSYLAPFRHIDRLRAGDVVEVDMPYADFTYRVERHTVIHPEDVDVLAPAGYDRLVLSACHPLLSASRRWIVFARLARVVPAAPVQHASSRLSRGVRRSDKGVQPGKGRRAGAAPRGDVIQPDDRTMRVDQLKREIARAQYSVNVEAVAEAVLARTVLRGAREAPVSPRRARSRRWFELRWRRPA